jgi:hypothetical protein
MRLRGMGAVALEPELVFQGVDDALDPLADPTKRSPPVRLVTAVGPDQHRAELAHSLGEPVAGQALVGGDDHPRAQQPLVAGQPQQRGRDLALAQLGGARPQATGMPSGAASRYSLRPQYQRGSLRS